MAFQSRINPVFDFHLVIEVFCSDNATLFQSRINPVFDFHLEILEQ